MVGEGLLPISDFASPSILFRLTVSRVRSLSLDFLQVRRSVDTGETPKTGLHSQSTHRSPRRETRKLPLRHFDRHGRPLRLRSRRKDGVRSRLGRVASRMLSLVPRSFLGWTGWSRESRIALDSFFLFTRRQCGRRWRGAKDSGIVFGIAWSEIVEAYTSGGSVARDEVGLAGSKEESERPGESRRRMRVGDFGEVET